MTIAGGEIVSEDGSVTGKPGRFRLLQRAHSPYARLD